LLQYTNTLLISGYLQIYTLTPKLPHNPLYRDKKEKHHTLYFNLRGTRIHSRGMVREIKTDQNGSFSARLKKIIGQKQRINKYEVALEPRL